MMVRSSMFAVVILGGALIVACGGGSSSGSGGGTQTSAPAAAPASTPPAAAASSSAPEPRTVADIFPPGPAKEMVMNNCASCHNVACSAIGQRSAERWDALKEAHRDRVGTADVEAMFAYLKANFGADKPEPKVPPKFLEGGCTPF